MNEVIFHEFDFETSVIELEVSKSNIWKHTTLCDNGVFLTLISRNFDDQLSSNVHRFVILCICWDTPSEKTGLWQLPIVSSVFKCVEGCCVPDVIWKFIPEFGSIYREGSIGKTDVTCSWHYKVWWTGAVWPKRFKLGSFCDFSKSKYTSIKI